jgi:hypothetical protein
VGQHRETVVAAAAAAVVVVPTILPLVVAAHLVKVQVAVKAARVAVVAVVPPKRVLPEMLVQVMVVRVVMVQHPLLRVRALLGRAVEVAVLCILPETAEPAAVVAEEDELQTGRMVVRTLAVARAARDTIPIQETIIMEVRVVPASLSLVTSRALLRRRVEPSRPVAVTPFIRLRQLAHLQ